MKKVTIISVCLMFAAGAIVCGDIFAQRGINNAQEAANAAKASLTNRPRGSSSQIEWLDQIIDVVNTGKVDSKDTSVQEDKSGKAE